MGENNNADLNNQALPADAEKERLEAEAKAEAEAKKQNVSQEVESLKKELERIKAKGEGHSRREKLLYTQKRLSEQLAKLDEEEGIETLSDDPDDNAPVTVGLLRKLEAKKAAKTALQLAEGIAEESEKELVKHHLQNTIKSTGDPDEDLRLARAIVNSAKNAQIAEEALRKRKPQSYAGGSGAPPLRADQFEPTEEESAFMKPPFNMSKEDVLKARKAAEAKLNR